jgi:RNA polymerase sigma factor (sigma-70 family)
MEAERDGFGQYLHEIRDVGPLARAEELALEQRLAAGDEGAIDEFIVSHLRLVVTMARRYAPEFDLDELVAQGNYGLMCAAREFQPGRGSFTTLATLWIRRALFDYAVCERAALAMSVDRAKKVHRVARAFQAAGREHPSLNDNEKAVLVAQTLGLSVGWVRAALAVRRPAGEPRGVSGATREPATDTDEWLDLRIKQWDVQVMLRLLPTPHAQLLRMTYGVDGVEHHSASAIQKSLGKKGPAIRMQRSWSLKRLRELDMQRGGAWEYRVGPGGLYPPGGGPRPPRKRCP